MFIDFRSSSKLREVIIRRLKKVHNNQIPDDLLTLVHDVITDQFVSRNTSNTKMCEIVTKKIKKGGYVSKRQEELSLELNKKIKIETDEHTNLFYKDECGEIQYVMKTLQDSNTVVKDRLCSRPSCNYCHELSELRISICPLHLFGVCNDSKHCEYHLDHTSMLFDLPQIVLGDKKYPDTKNTQVRDGLFRIFYYTDRIRVYDYNTQNTFVFTYNKPQYTQLFTESSTVTNTVIHENMNHIYNMCYYLYTCGYNSLYQEGMQQEIEYDIDVLFCAYASALMQTEENMFPILSKEQEIYIKEKYSFTRQDINESITYYILKDIYQDMFVNMFMFCCNKELIKTSILNIVYGMLIGYEEPKQNVYHIEITKSNKLIHSIEKESSMLLKCGNKEIVIHNLDNLDNFRSVINELLSN